MQPKKVLGNVVTINLTAVKIKKCPDACEDKGHIICKNYHVFFPNL